MELAPGKPQIVRRPIDQFGNSDFDLGQARLSCSVVLVVAFDREPATARSQSAAEMSWIGGFIRSPARRCGRPGRVALGRSEGEAELLLPSPREDAAHRMAPPAR